MTTKEQIERNKANVHRFLEHTHSGRFDVVDELIAQDVVTHGFPGGNNPDSPAAYRRFFEGLDQAFPEMEFTVIALVAEGDRVAAHFSIRARHAGDYLGVPATGRRVSFTGMAIYRMRDGRIAETWLYPDNVTLLQQLGMLPMAA